MTDWALWIAAGSVALLILGTLWLMFREGSPRASPWAYGEVDGEEGGRERHGKSRSEAGDAGDGGDGGGGDGGGGGGDGD